MLTEVDFTTSAIGVRLAAALLSFKGIILLIIYINVLGPPYASANMGVSVFRIREILN